ncbi:MAG: hypothetical protein HY592_00855 [Candidatus Omnitrophica bacterium]|nr:hypothetical protein [Candidatus Omnitrophota bacterium]
MRNFLKKGRLVLLFSLLSFVAVSPAFAAESKSENSVTGFFRRLFNYPVKATQETGEMTANTVSNVGEKVLSDSGEHLSEGEVPQAVVQPVVGAAETLGQAAAETVQIPVEAAKEDAPDTAPATA